MSAISRLPTNLFPNIKCEISLFFDFSWRDWSTTLIPTFFLCIAAIRSVAQPVSTAFVALALLRTLGYFTLFVYQFNLANQIAGVEEDRLNKPSRPIASGKVTIDGAICRYALMVALYLFAGIAFDVLPETLGWIFNTIFLNFAGGSEHYITKNIIGMTIGTLCLLRSSWLLVTPLTPNSSTFCLIVAIWLGVNMDRQDLRDVSGDKLMKRRTLVIQIGDHAARIIIALNALISPLLWLWLPLASSSYTTSFLGILYASECYGAYRVLRADSARYDHKTYMLMTYVFCGILVCAAVLGIDRRDGYPFIRGIATT